ncbi:hypothetical protein INR49_032276 [Caranx melampygus]|nr:hypothetical protein INR49_032276 [Caranx melampygus]
MATAMLPGDNPQLRRAHKTIADLLEDIHRLSDELRSKEALLTQCMDSALSAALQDTVPWDPSGPRPPSCSTPHLQRLWAEVVVQGQQRTSLRAGSPPLPLSNRFEALSQLGEDPGDGQGWSADQAPVVAAAPSPPETGATSAAPPRSNGLSSAGPVAPSPSPNNTAAEALRSGSTSPPLLPGGVQRRHSTGAPDHQLSSRTTTSASRCRLLKEAVLRCSGSLHGERAHDPPPGAEAAPGSGSRHRLDLIPQILRCTGIGWPSHTVCQCPGGTMRGCQSLSLICSSSLLSESAAGAFRGRRALGMS